MSRDVQNIRRAADGLRREKAALAQDRDDQIRRDLGEPPYADVARHADLWSAYYRAVRPIQAALDAIGCGECPTCGQPVQELDAGLPHCQVCGSALAPDDDCGRPVMTEEAALAIATAVIERHHDLNDLEAA